MGANPISFNHAAYRLSMMDAENLDAAPMLEVGAIQEITEP